MASERNHAGSPSPMENTDDATTVDPGIAGPAATTRASHYTHGYGAAVLSSHAHRTAENSAGYLLPRLRPGMDLLDVGCGVGTITAGLAQRVVGRGNADLPGNADAPGGAGDPRRAHGHGKAGPRPGHVEAIDVSAQVVSSTQTLARERGFSDAEVHAQVADVMALPWPDESFDVVHAHQVLQHLEDPVGALREMRRVLRPGGWLAVRDADYGAMRWYPDSAGLERWRQIYTGVARANGGSPDAGRRLLAWVRAAGFSHVDHAGASTWCYADPESREWWARTWAQRIGLVDQPGLGRDAIQQGAATSAELAGLAEDWRAWGADPDGWFAVVHGEILARR